VIHMSLNYGLKVMKYELAKLGIELACRLADEANC
jgi:hypothetical protein